jgi:presenilin 1
MTTALSSPRDEIELQNSDPVPPADSQCNVCRKPAAFMCSSCGLNGPRYCSTECQSQGWREGHYRLCQGNAQARANAASRASNHTQTESPSGPPSGQGSIPMVELRNNGNSTEQDEQQEFADELRFYIKQIYLVIQPVVICIILSIFWVKVAFSGSSDYTPVRPSYSIGSSTTTTSGGSDSSSSSAITSLTTALVIVGQIIVVTLVIVFLFRRGWIKVSAKEPVLKNSF